MDTPPKKIVMDYEDDFPSLPAHERLPTPPHHQQSPGWPNSSNKSMAPVRPTVVTQVCSWEKYFSLKKTKLEIFRFPDFSFPGRRTPLFER